MNYEIIHGDCLEVMRGMANNSIDAIVTDPPYGLSDHKPVEVVACLSAWIAGEPYQPKGRGFMGKAWDAWVPGPEVWREVLRVLKPGGHALVFAGTRSMDLMSMALRLAGFELRDSIGYAHDDDDDSGAPLLAWVYGSGFPKSLDVSKAIDRAAGAERECTRPGAISRGAYGDDWDSADSSTRPRYDKPATEAARQWAGWGTALKPSHEPVIIARKPLSDNDKLATIKLLLNVLGARLWSMLSVSAAERYFGLSQSELGAAFGSAQWSADERSSTRDGLCAVMGASQFELATISSLNTVSSWLSTLEDASKHGNTFITETASSTTIDWKTLRFFASQITPSTIIQAHKSGAWLSADACIAARNLNAMLATLSATLELSVLAPATSQWLDNCQEQEGKTLSPSFEPVIIARKPLIGTVAENVLRFGTGAINIDACRVPTEERPKVVSNRRLDNNTYAPGLGGSSAVGTTDEGRWPANLITDGGEAVTSRLGEQSRFFYCAKASKKDRDDGLDGFGERKSRTTYDKSVRDSHGNDSGYTRRNTHPTVKPTDLMRYLCRLVTPPGGVVLDPFAGSGSTGKGAVLEGFGFIGIELSDEYVEIARARIEVA